MNAIVMSILRYVWENHVQPHYESALTARPANMTLLTKLRKEKIVGRCRAVGVFF